LKIRVQELFTHAESISTPRARHKGQYPFTQVCKKRDFNIIYFPFFISFSLFGVDKGMLLLLRILRCDEEFRPTYFFKSECLCVKLIFMFLKDSF